MVDRKVIDAVLVLVGTDGMERISAISRLLPRGHNYRENPELLACHLLEIGIEQVENAVLEAVGISVVDEERKT